jgi:F420-dependent oxidoreductase-like protein
MLDIAIMIEGQNGLNWPRWQRIAQAVENLGFAGLFRSDHYTNANPPDLDSLELWVSLTWLADHTRRIEFGPLVTPVSFRHPTMTARMAAALDDLSGGRLVLGIGAGWQEREHSNYGWQLLDPQERFRRFEEGLQVIKRLLNDDRPVNFDRQYFHLKEAVVLPKPERPGGPRILVGGNGARHTLSLTARYADEWNAVYIPVEKFTQLNSRLNEMLAEEGRSESSVRRSMMTGCVFGRDQGEVRRKVEARTQSKIGAGGLRQRGLLVGTSAEMIDQLERLSEAGVQRIMLQWLDLDDLESLQALAEGVLPHFR